MATNDNQSRAATCIASTERLPWWALLALAGLSFFALHAMALRPQTIVVDPGDVAAALGGFLLGGVQESLQYVVPALCMSLLLARLAPLPAEALGTGGADGFPVDAGKGRAGWESGQLTPAGLSATSPPQALRGHRLAAPGRGAAPT